jgi:cytochrome c biogenesis factor
VLGAALLGMVGRTSGDDGAGTAVTLHRWTAGAAALLTTATLQGSWWAHDELGWGGWWAWDPVENTALAPMVCLFAALHARSETVATRWRLSAAACVLAGIAMTRSGLPMSVHAFAPSGWVAVVFAFAAVFVLFHLVRTWWTSHVDVVAPARPRVHPAAVAEVVTAVCAGWIVVVVVAAGVAASWLGTRDPVGAIDGRLLGTLTAPVGIAALAALLLAGFRRHQRAVSLMAHTGVVVFAIGVVGSLASTTHAGTVDVGSTTRLGGRDVTIIGARVVEERPDLVALRIEAMIDGRPVVASILDHPDLNRTRARPGRLIDAGGETELVVSLLAGDRARVELRRHPGLLYVWIGGALCAAGLAGSAVAGGVQRPSRRRRLASSSDSSEDPESAPSAGARSGDTGEVEPTALDGGPDGAGGGAGASGGTPGEAAGG